MLIHHRHRPRVRFQQPRTRRRGQGLVEFALILPVIMLLMLITIDFGRALYGWVVLQNSARIAANFAGLNPDGWRPPAGNAVVKGQYGVEVLNDLAAANCDHANAANVPSPVFVDGPDIADPDGPPDTAYDVGDSVKVSLVCTFHPITPIISAILGNNVQLGASSEFRIRTGDVVGMANATAIPPPTPSASPSASSSASATASASASATASTPPPPCIVTAKIKAPNGTGKVNVPDTFDGTTSTATGCSIASYTWTFESGTPSTSTNASQAVFWTVKGDYNITLFVTSNTGVSSSTVTASWKVTP
jgi:hypothetical protein